MRPLVQHNPNQPERPSDCEKHRNTFFLLHPDFPFHYSIGLNWCPCHLYNDEPCPLLRSFVENTKGTEIGTRQIHSETASRLS